MARQPVLPSDVFGTAGQSLKSWLTGLSPTPEQWVKVPGQMAGEEKNKTKTTHYSQRIHVNVAMALNCHLQASLTFAFEKTSRHKHAFSWASKLPMLGISSLQNIEGIIMWSTSKQTPFERNYMSNCVQTALEHFLCVKGKAFTYRRRAI